MKKVIAFLLVLSVVFSFAACKQKEDYSLGSSFRVGKIEYTIGSSYETEVLDHYYYQGQTAIIVPITAKNVGKESANVGSYQIKVFNPNGVEGERITSIGTDNILQGKELLDGAVYDSHLYILYEGNGAYKFTIEDIMAAKSATVVINVEYEEPEVPTENVMEEPDTTSSESQAISSNYTKYYSYDSDGNRTVEETKWEDGRVEKYEYTSYDGNGNILTYVHTDTNGENTRVERTYDEHNNLLKSKIKYDQYPDEYFNTYEYEYDERGNELSCIYRGGYHNCFYLYTYDENDNMITCTSNSGYGYHDTMTYDENGNILTSETFDGYKHVYTYTFDDNGKIQKTECVYSYGDEIISTTVKMHDSNENVVSETCTWTNGNFSSTTYSYDAAGNLVTETYKSVSDN